MEEIYQDLIISSLQAALFFPFESELVFKSIVAFDEYSKPLIFVLALVAGMAGLLINYGVFRFIFNEPVITNKLAEGYNKAKHIFNNYLTWTLFFSCFDIIGPFITVFAGILQVRFKIFLGSILISKTAYYLYYIL